MSATPTGAQATDKRKTPFCDQHAVWPACNDDSDSKSRDGSHLPIEDAHELERRYTEACSVADRLVESNAALRARADLADQFKAECLKNGISDEEQAELPKLFRWQRESLEAFRDKFGVPANCNALDAIDKLKERADLCARMAAALEIADDEIMSARTLISEGQPADAHSALTQAVNKVREAVQSYRAALGGKEGAGT